MLTKRAAGAPARSAGPASSIASAPRAWQPGDPPAHASPLTGLEAVIALLPLHAPLGGLGLATLPPVRAATGLGLSPAPPAPALGCPLPAPLPSFAAAAAAAAAPMLMFFVFPVPRRLLGGAPGAGRGRRRRCLLLPAVLL